MELNSKLAPDRGSLTQNLMPCSPFDLLTSIRQLTFGALLAAGIWTVVPSTLAAVDVTRAPDQIRVVTETGTSDQAISDQARVTTERDEAGLQVHLQASKTAVKSIELHWLGTVDPATKCLGDAWERAYADLGWRALAESGNMPWYFLATINGITDGYGVLTGPGAMCHWTADPTGVTLIADVRNGGMGVQLGDRTLDVCTVIEHAGTSGEESLDVAVAFCKQMCAHPRTPGMPIYGYNDWNSTYGHNTADGFIRDAATLAALCPDGPNRPFMVVDDGWQANRQGGQSAGNPWDRTNAAFGSTMPELAQRVKALNARPGLWYRPLEAWPSAPKEQLLRGTKNVFDPSVPAVRERIADDMRRFRSWGFQLVKHDFTTNEILGRWGSQMGTQITADGWTFADRTRTTAEIITDLYRTIREAGGDGMTIDGCNTLSHLSAGLFEACRIGDDTSGEDWTRTRKFGVNALAFRAAQQGGFYAADPDMVGLAKAGAIPWEKNKQWLELVSHSGTVLFVSWKVDLLDDSIRAALRAAFAAAAKPQPFSRPLDWLDSRQPTHWLLDGRETTFSW